LTAERAENAEVWFIAPGREEQTAKDAMDAKGAKETLSKHRAQTSETLGTPSGRHRARSILGVVPKITYESVRFRPSPARQSFATLRPSRP
jgi:hypothetical protein